MRLRRLEPVLRRALRGPCRLPAGSTLLVAVSGGADSTALLVALASLARESGLVIRAGHLHHGLRGAEADSDLVHVRELCERLQIPLAAARWDCTARMRRRGLRGEAGLRVLRREFLLAAARRTGASAIATAHTADDQLETLLMRLARGTGFTGMAGMRAPRRVDQAAAPGHEGRRRSRSSPARLELVRRREQRVNGLHAQSGAPRGGAGAAGRRRRRRGARGGAPSRACARRRTPRRRAGRRAPRACPPGRARAGPRARRDAGWARDRCRSTCAAGTGGAAAGAGPGVASARPGRPGRPRPHRTTPDLARSVPCGPVERRVGAAVGLASPGRMRPDALPGPVRRRRPSARRSPARGRRRC